MSTTITFVPSRSLHNHWAVGRCRSHTKEDGIVIDANTGGLVIEGGNGGKNFDEGGRCVRLARQKNSNDWGNGVIDITKNVAIAKDVGDRSRAPDIKCTRMKRLRRIMIPIRAATNVGDCGFSNRTVRAKRHEWELGEAKDTKDAKDIKLEETRVVKMTTTTMCEVAT